MEYRRLSDLARVRLKLRDNSTEIFIKFHKHPHSPEARVQAKSQLEYETLTWLFDAFASMPGYSVVRPIAYFSEYKAVVTEKAEGLDLPYVAQSSSAHRRRYRSATGGGGVL